MRRVKRARAAKCVFWLEWLCVSESPASSRIAQRCDVARFLRRRIPACLHFCTADSILSRRRLLHVLRSYNKLEGSLPAELGRLTSLTFLKGDYNQLGGSLPRTLG